MFRRITMLGRAVTIAAGLFVAGTSVQARTLEGQVFIATAGGQAIKLPLVEIRIVPRNPLEQQIASMAHTRQAEVMRCTNSLAAVNGEYQRLLNVRGKMIERYHNLPPTGRQRDRAEAAMKAEDAQTGPGVQQLAAKQGRILRELESLTSPAVFFQSLPNEAVAVTKTDADGRFALEIPDADEHILVARASRDVHRNSEQYYWLVLITPEATKITLANDNLSTVWHPIR